MGLSHHSPPHQDLFFFLIFYAAPSQTLGQQGRSQDEEEREVNPTPDQTRAWRGVLPTLSLPKKTLSFSRKEPSPAWTRPRQMGGEVGAGGGIWRKASFGNTLAGWQLEYYRFSACCVMDQSFLPIFSFPGGEPTYSFFQGHFFFFFQK